MDLSYTVGCVKEEIKLLITFEKKVKIITPGFYMS